MNNVTHDAMHRNAEKDCYHAKIGKTIQTKWEDERALPMKKMLLAEHGDDSEAFK